MEGHIERLHPQAMTYAEERDLVVEEDVSGLRPKALEHSSANHEESRHP
jgi:hypothetical protein